MGSRLKQEIALALHGGFFERKQLIPGHGITNSGKGVLTNALRATFSDYIGIWHTSALAPDGKDTVNDSKRYGFMCDIYRNRLNIANENIRGLKLSTEKFCTVVSGGDQFKARKLWGNEYEIMNYSTMMALANDPIKFDNVNSAVQERFPGLYEFEVQFVKKPLNKFHKKSVKGLKTMIHSKKYCDALFWIIVDTYQNLKNQNFVMTDPKLFIQNKQDIFSKKVLTDIWYEYIEYTGDVYDRISNDDVFDLIRVEFKNIDFTKMINLLSIMVKQLVDMLVINLRLINSVLTL